MIAACVLSGLNDVNQTYCYNIIMLQCLSVLHLETFPARSK